MIGIFNSIRRLAFRVQPVSHIRKRGNRKEEQERRDQHYAFENQLRSVREKFGYSKKEWSV